MKGVADRTPELMNEYQADLDHKSFRTFQHFLVVKIEELEAEKEVLRKALLETSREVAWTDADGPNHAKRKISLNAIVNALLTERNS